MKRSAIFFAIFLLVLLVAVLSERREEKTFSDSMAMGENATTQITTPNQDLDARE